ncbi:MAG: hypothetical protein ACX930_04790 [Erythrobacter sp.]
MSKLVQDHLARGKARIVEAPVAKPEMQVEGDRNFGIPTGFYAMTGGFYLAFVAVMAAGFGSSGLVIPMVIFAFFIVAGFGVPAIWTRLKDNASKPMSGAEFRSKGIMTNTGRLAPRDAAIQMLILPVLIVLWGFTSVIVAALVS